jgi:small subunit ribosomal protein S15
VLQQACWIFAQLFERMAVYLTTGKKEEIFKEYGGDTKNTGSTEAQVALFTFRIKKLSEHLHIYKKDHVTRRSLLTMVGKRKRLLEYLQKKDITKYRELISKLGIRG